jgi:hypothetical protein
MSLLHSARADNRSMAEPLSGLAYAFTVPGRVLWPSVVGLPLSWVARPMPALLPWLLGIAALTGMALCVPRSPWWY